MSPGTSVKLSDSTETTVAISKIMSFVFELCRVRPFTRVITARLFPSPASSLVTIQGPRGPKLSSALPLNHWLWARCTSRAETSFMMV